MPSGQIARWLQEIGNYNLTITHRPGRQHGNADALSRKPCKACSRQQDKNTELEAKDNKESVIRMDNAQLCQTRTITRSQGTSNTEYPVQNQLMLKGWELSEIKETQSNDQNLSFIHLCIEKGLDKPDWNQVSGENTIVKTLWNQYARLKVINWVLYRKWIDANGITNKMQMLVPESLKEEILKF